MKYCYNHMTVFGQYESFPDSNEKGRNTVPSFAYANSSSEIKEEKSIKSSSLLLLTLLRNFWIWIELKGWKAIYIIN